MWNINLSCNIISFSVIWLMLFSLLGIVSRTSLSIYSFIFRFLFGLIPKRFFSKSDLFTYWWCPTWFNFNKWIKCYPIEDFEEVLDLDKTEYIYSVTGFSLTSNLFNFKIVEVTFPLKEEFWGSAVTFSTNEHWQKGYWVGLNHIWMSSFVWLLTWAFQQVWDIVCAL